jgi:AcrR family transcriptional regulator
MHSNKSRARKPRAPVEPQRRPGRERVAKLLEVGAAVIAEKGYEAATMAEIAARADSPIGSLYRFFPSKELLAEALIDRYTEQIEEEFGKIAARAKTASTDEIANAILDFTVIQSNEMEVIVALLEARADGSVRRQAFRNGAVKHIGVAVALLAPKMPACTVRDVAVILLHNMKLMKALKFQHDVPTSPGAMEELRQMNRLYLASRIASFPRLSEAD